jgi:hypothetical protein
MHHAQQRFFFPREERKRFASQYVENEERSRHTGQLQHTHTHTQKTGNKSVHIPVNWNHNTKTNRTSSSP